MNRRAGYVLACVLAVLLTIAIGLVSWHLATDEKKANVKRVFGIPLTEQGQKAYGQIKTEATDGDDLGHMDLSNEAPPGSPLYQNPEAQAEATLRAQDEATKETVGPDDVPDPRTLAEPSQRGCRSGPWVVNKSSRNGARPAMLDAHLTVSHNVAGWSDVLAIVAWFNNTRSQASSNYVIDAEGNCAYIVNEAYKSWTEGWFNPWGISIEFIHYSPTSTSEKWTNAQLKKGALVFADASKRWGIPIRLTNPTECNVVAGITDHDRLECGNEHVDVGTQENGTGVHRGTFPMTKFVNMIDYYTWPRCNVPNVKSSLNRELHPSKPLVVNDNYSDRAKRFMVRFKESAGLNPTPVVSKLTGMKLNLRGCDSSIK